MTDNKAALPSPCEAVGTLIFKDHCYALRRDDGAEMWLELDRAPAHLIDHPVRVEGELYSQKLICVDRIGPAN
ncbi:MAG: DUF5818 domain-containing protein [Sphingobium sp.]